MKTTVSPYGYTGLSFPSLTDLREFLTAQGFVNHVDGFQKRLSHGGLVIASFYGDGNAWFLVMKTSERIIYA